MTYVALANITLGSSASSVTFSSIPNTFRDLVLVAVLPASTNTYAFLRFNGDAGSNYNYIFAYGDGSIAPSQAFSNTAQGYIGNTNTNLLNTVIVNIMDYSATDKHKSYINRSNVPDNLTMMNAGRWANTSAITSMSVNTNAGNFNSGSSFALYGIAS